MSSANFQNASPPSVIAKVIQNALLAKNPKARYAAGKMISTLYGTGQYFVVVDNGTTGTSDVEVKDNAFWYGKSTTNNNGVYFRGASAAKLTGNRFNLVKSSTWLVISSSSVFTTPYNILNPTYNGAN